MGASRLLGVGVGVGLGFGVFFACVGVVEGVVTTYTFTTFVVTTTTGEGRIAGAPTKGAELEEGEGTCAINGTTTAGTSATGREVTDIPVPPPTTPKTKKAATTNQPRRWPSHGPS